MLLMGAYYTSYLYTMFTDSAAAAQMFAPANFFFILLLWILPPLMTFFFTGYLRPTRGKAKMTMLGPSVFSGVIFFIIAFMLTESSTLIENLLVFSSWGIGSALLTAGGFSIVQSYEQSTSPGMLDVSSLHYGPPKEEEEEVEAEEEEEVPEAEAPTEPVEEKTDEVTEPTADSEEPKPAEGESE
jgi:hypothetical protein